MFLSFENIPKDLMVEDDGIIFDFFQSTDSIVVVRVSRLTYQVHIVVMVNPRNFKSERSKLSC